MLIFSTHTAAMQIATQLNQSVDCSGNGAAILAATAEAGARARLVVTPELSLCGYPPEDLAAAPGISTPAPAARAGRRRGGHGRGRRISRAGRRTPPIRSPCLPTGA
jgi:hypothetical protein